MQLSTLSKIKALLLSKSIFFFSWNLGPLNNIFWGSLSLINQRPLIKVFVIFITERGSFTTARVNSRVRNKSSLFSSEANLWRLKISKHIVLVSSQITVGTAKFMDLFKKDSALVLLKIVQRSITSTYLLLPCFRFKWFI